jgi:hypothetical protein
MLLLAISCKVAPNAALLPSMLPLIPTKKRLAKRATEMVGTAYRPFRHLFHFIEARQLCKIKRIFPNLFQILCVAVVIVLIKFTKNN